MMFIYSHGWYPEILSGSLMGILPYEPKVDRVVELIAMNCEPDEYHIWPQWLNRRLSERDKIKAHIRQ